MTHALLKKTNAPDVSGLPYCDTCANGCDCRTGTPGCAHYACWGTGTEADTTCPGATRERTLMAAYNSTRQAAPRG